MRPFGSPEQLEWRRRRAIAMLEEGSAPVEVAAALGVDRRSVRRWKAAVERGGVSAVAARAAAGRPLKLGARQRAQLEGALLKGARASGFPTDLWTCPRVAQVICSRFGVQYHEDHVGRLLHGLGWSPQRPQRRAAERDEERIARWVKVVWPAIKKKPLG
jgi:transposase